VIDPNSAEGKGLVEWKPGQNTDRLGLSFLDQLVAAMELKLQLSNLKDPVQPEVLGNTPLVLRLDSRALIVAVEKIVVLVNDSPDLHAPLPGLHMPWILLSMVLVLVQQKNGVHPILVGPTE
jgi:hypothetical protein